MIKGKALKAEIDENGNIKVATEYTLTDGSKKTGHTRYNFVNFTAIKVLADIKTHCQTLMTRVYGLKRHRELINEVDLSNTTHDCVSVEIVIKAAVRDPQGNIITPAETLMIDDK